MHDRDMTCTALTPPIDDTTGCAAARRRAVTPPSADRRLLGSVARLLADTLRRRPTPSELALREIDDARHLTRW